MSIHRAILCAAAIGLVAGGQALAQSASAPAPAATSSVPTASAAATAAEPAAPAPVAPEAVSAPEAAPAPAKEAKGHIVFFRPSRLSGAIYTYHVVEVGDDGKPAKGAAHLADLSNGAAFTYDAEPGVHSYNITGPMAINKDEDRIRMEVEPGETYYVEQTIRIGIVTGGFRLVPADEARFHAANVKMAAPKVLAAK